MMILRLARLGLFAAALAAVAAIVSPNAIAQPANTRLSQDSAARAYVHLQALAGRVGERAAGTESEKLAVDYIRSQFDSWGLQTQLVSFPVPVWRQRRARLWVEGEGMIDFPAKGAVFAGLTGAEGITAEFVNIGSGSEREIEGKDLRGKIVLIQRDVYMEYPDVDLTDRLSPKGVAGMIFYSAPGRKGLPTVYFNFKRALKEPTPPAVVISHEDAMRLARLQPKQVGLALQADIEWKESHSVVADVKGATKPAEIVILAAHNDTSYDSPGATDDAGGVAVIMELARTFAAGPRPARTLRFIAWGGHELGLAGSEAYLRTRENEIAKTVAYINYDIVGAPLGSVFWGAAGDDSWHRFLSETARSVGLTGFGGDSVTNTEATVFAALEIPSASLVAGGGNENHSAWDNLDLTSPAGLVEPLLLGAALAERLAADTKLTFPHKIPADALQVIRDDAARYGWGIRPEANKPPRSSK